MFSKKIILSVVLVLTLSGAMAAYHWWKTAERPSDPQKTEPPAAEEFGKVMQAFNRADSLFEVSGTIRIYDKEKKNQLKETKTFSFCRSAMGYYAQLSYLQTFCDGTWAVHLDTVHHRIRLSKAPDVSGGKLSGVSLNALFNDTARFRLTGTVTDEGKERALRLQNEFRPEIRSSVLFYDTLSYRLHRVEMEWWKPSAMPDEKGQKIWLTKIDYLYRPTTPPDPAQKIRSILKVTDGRVTLTPAYHDYELNLDNN